MDRRKQVRDLVMDAIANDYEPFALIVDEVTAWGRDESLDITEFEVFDTLVELINQGLAQCYALPAMKPVPAHTNDDAYYYLTPAGIEEVKRSYDQ